MADKEFIGGVTNTVLHFETDGTMHVEERLDIEPILNYTHAMRNHRFDADALDGMLRHVGEVPFTLFQDECQRRGITPTLHGEEQEKVINYLLQKHEELRAAPKTRDPHVIMKGAR